MQATVVHGGREAWDRVNPIWGSGTSRPWPACVVSAVLRDTDAALLVWDMMDLAPNGYDVPWSVHGVIFAYGVGLVDNALLEPLAKRRLRRGRALRVHADGAATGGSRRDGLASEPGRALLRIDESAWGALRAPRRQSLLRSQARCALLPAATSFKNQRAGQEPADTSHERAVRGIDKPQAS